MLERLKVFRDPAVAWTRFTRGTRKEVLRALSKCVTIYPNFDGYFVVADWDGGGRAAARVTTTRRRKLYPAPDEVLALFDSEMGDESAHGTIAARLGRVSLRV